MPVRHTRLAMAALTVLFAISCAGGEAPDPDPNLERHALDERQEAFLGALAERDAAAMEALFSADGELHVAGRSPIRGIEAIGEFYGNVFRFLRATSATPDRLVVSAGGDMAFSTGSTSNEFMGPDGPVSYTGKYVLVWRRIDGQWRIVVYSISSNESDEGS